MYSLLLIAFLSVSSVACYKSYEGYELWSFQLRTSAQEAMFSEIESHFPENLVDVWSLKRRRGQILLAPQVSRNLTSLLRENGVRMQRRPVDVQRMINAQKRQNRLLRFQSRMQAMYPLLRRPHTFFMRYTELLQWVRNAAKSCRPPLQCSTQVIGQTRYHRELLVIKISTGRRRDKIWLDAGIHAREWIAPSTALYLIDKLIKYGPDARRILDKYDVYILPLFNPDGYEYTHTHTRFWRKNLMSSYSSPCFGVDLNRNWGYQWGGRGASTAPCMENYRGLSAFSERETLSTSRYLRSIKDNLKLFITLHSFGQFILMPFSHKRNTYPANIHKLRAIGHRVAQSLDAYSGRFYDVGSAADLLYEAAGGSDDYASAELGIPYPFTIELPDEGRYGFLLPPQYIRQVGEEMWVALQEFTKNVATDR